MRREVTMQSGFAELWMAGGHTGTRQKTSASSLGACVLGQKGENDLGFTYVAWRPGPLARVEAVCLCRCCLTPLSCWSSRPWQHRDACVPIASS